MASNGGGYAGRCADIVARWQSLQRVAKVISSAGGRWYLPARWKEYRMTYGRLKKGQLTASIDSRSLPAPTRCNHVQSFNLMQACHLPLMAKHTAFGRGTRCCEMCLIMICREMGTKHSTLNRQAADEEWDNETMHVVDANQLLVLDVPECSAAQQLRPWQHRHTHSATHILQQHPRTTVGWAPAAAASPNKHAEINYRPPPPPPAVHSSSVLNSMQTHARLPPLKSHHATLQHPPPPRPLRGPAMAGQRQRAPLHAATPALCQSKATGPLHRRSRSLSR
jgi:hypothetical protein